MNYNLTRENRKEFLGEKYYFPYTLKQTNKKIPFPFSKNEAILANE